jgi:hypothetical protein
MQLRAAVRRPKKCRTDTKGIPKRASRGIFLPIVIRAHAPLTTERGSAHAL